MKQVFFLTAIFFTVLTFGQDIPLGKNKFKADFTVDSVTLGVESNQVNVSGDVGGGYGRVYLLLKMAPLTAKWDMAKIIDSKIDICLMPLGIELFFILVDLGSLHATKLAPESGRKWM